MTVSTFLFAVNQGLLWGIMAIGVWITYRVLNYADLTAEGSFTLGAAVAARLITSGYDPLISTLIAIGAGMLAGLTTGFLHTVLRVPPLLSGILAMTGLYSINLRIMGMANIPLLRGTDTLMTRMASLLGTSEFSARFTLWFLYAVLLLILVKHGIQALRSVTRMERLRKFLRLQLKPARSLLAIACGAAAALLTWLALSLSGSASFMEDMASWFPATERTASIWVGLIFVLIVIYLLRLFFNTEIGYALRATGDNEHMVKAQGVNTNRMKILGLMMGNACVALSGALAFQALGFADINMGIGTIVVGLASVIIGEVIFRDKNNHRALIAVVLGSILYRVILAFVLALGIHHNDFRLISAAMLAFALSLPLIREKLNWNVKRLFGANGRGQA